MKPEPTPVSGTAPSGSVVVPAVVIFTTAGLSLAATSMTADDSLIETGCWLLPIVLPEPTVEVGTGLSNAPARSRTSTVPVDATTADRSEAAMTVPIPGPALREDGGCWTCTGATGSVATEDHCGWPQAGAAGRAGSPGAGSYQRSAGWPDGEAHAQRASGRGSGVGT